ncbi:F-box DNA helicase 1 [Clinocottus analis]|uniref:F-box DNA helicase 1 n=1 Tax=Clinocottus analis TaxID=304258 RepID=UPI0035C0D688
MEMSVKGKAKRRHLNAGECDDLGQSAEGTNSLAQPHTVNHRPVTRSSDRGLNPRTPTKRQKCASASGSPSGQQKSINNFFSVTGVISSSPNKSSQPGSSTRTNGPRGKLFSDKEQGVMKEEEEDDDDNDDDDVSLLAASLADDPEDEEEVGNGSLSASELVEKEEDNAVDHLEGITAEMFGDDDEFDRRNGDLHHVEDEVEALPDAHYGLLGSRKVLLDPQGCMDDLPDEVLRQILCLVPAQDLYRSVSHVCNHWWNIIQDRKFVPFKKQYFRYMMRERETVQEICDTMRNSSITDPAASQHSIRHLVILMSQHTVGERVRPEDVLERVKKHHLYPQAEASIRLRIPDIQKLYNLGIEGPNPYAAMAIILILSEGIDDVQALVSLLTGCLSDSAITEYLSHMATMLLAAKRSSIKISSRVHYNIYHILHLMENGPFSVNSGQNQQPQIQLTGEQQQVLSHDIQKNHIVKIVAFAGTGKTTTLVKYAEQRPHLRFLYVAFNKSVASEAMRRFPSNVACKTVHSLAFAEVGRRYHFRRKLTSNLKPFAISSVLPQGRGGYQRAKVVASTLNAFMASADPAIAVQHVPHSRKHKNREIEVFLESDRELYALEAQTIWSKMTELNETKIDAYHMTHDGYLKLWQLQVPEPCLSHKYDVLFIDEAQDCTPVILDVLLSQNCAKILVGDPHQQIYTFRGAVNALDIIVHTHIFYLTQSFRFGAEIAYVGATILEVCKGVEKVLVGGKQRGGVCDETADNVRAALKAGVSLCPGKTAILSRCNVSVFSEAVRLTDSNPQCRIHFVGGVNGIGLNRILDIWQLMEQGSKFIRDPLIRCFVKKKPTGFWALKRYVEQTEDLELEAKLTIVEKYGKRIPELAARLERCFVEDFHTADFIVGTVHKAKGLEFDTVMVTDDFAKIPFPKANVPYNFSFCDIPDDEWNLLYVAVTRAKRSLIITDSIRRILTVAAEYFLKSAMPSTLVGDPLPCCVSDCPNCTTPGSAFIMYKRQLKCSDGVSEGGPLCERCVWARIGGTAFLMTDDVLSMAEMPRILAPQDHRMLLELL